MFEFKFTDIGEGLEEGKICNILIQVGQQVKEGDPAFSVETDKVTTDIPSPVDGIVSKILVNNDDQIHVGQVLAYIDTNVSASSGNNNLHTQVANQVPNTSFAPTPAPSFATAPAPTSTFTPTFTPNPSPAPMPTFNPTPTNVESAPTESASVVGEVKTSNKVLPLFGSQKLF
ncbi:biotin/lipoyl-containing protein [Mycoplasmoides pirum]|uniref:biotin/lipoyl-containing protein n=1 Tax=Mycoplasmoides pirum TaxID=2122 RepID=UPI000ADC6356|nr:biotin/lipoyl-containing protein [Mycoplasmoides pirum]